MAEKPSIIIFGGCGFIGRNLVQYLVSNELCSKIRVVDKQLPDMVGLSAKQLQMYRDRVEFKQANLSKAPSCAKAFADGKFEFAVNLAGETKYSQTPEVYKENIIDLSVNVAKASAEHKVKKYIEVSTAQVYASDKKKSDESGKLKPYTKMAEAKLAAEEELRKIPNLNLVIVRPALVYGPGDVISITPRVIVAAVYKFKGEEMQFLWDKELKMNTVHVTDVANALWHLLNNGKVGEVYNLADSGETEQGEVAKILESMFGIKTSFYGFLKSKAVTSVAMKTVAETVNDKHLKPWSELCKEKGIHNSILTPYLDEELLYDDSLSVDGKKIITTGFEYSKAKITEALVREATSYFVENGNFPKDYF